MTHINFEVPTNLHKKFKIYSIMEKKDMKDILVEMIKEKVKNN